MSYSHALRGLAWRLARWAVPSVIVGTLLPFSSAPFVRGFGFQALAWGAVDLVLALSGLVRAKRRAAAHPDEVRDVRDTLRLYKILVINARLDILYLLGGITIAVLLWHDAFWAGTGTGIVVQALFLLYFDSSEARQLPGEAPSWYDPQR